MQNPKNIEIHLLQAISANAINCGQNGEIKTLGDRQRISSQAWKRPARIMLNDLTNIQSIQTRSIKPILESSGISDEKIEKIINLSKLLSANDDSEKGVVAKYSSSELDFLKKLVNSDEEYLGKLVCKKAGKTVLSDEFKQHFSECEQALGIALFGRMFASESNFDIYAAAKYSHSYSTHSVNIEDDYFTAIDDLNSNGAAHINSKNYTESVQYRYINIDYAQLVKNLNRPVDITEMVNIINSIILAFPTGKENAMYCRTRPEYIRISVRNNNFPYAAFNAFEKKILDSGDGFMKPSINAIQEFFNKNDKMWGDEYLYVGELTPNGDMTYNELINNVIKAL